MFGCVCDLKAFTLWQGRGSRFNSVMTGGNAWNTFGLATALMTAKVLLKSKLSWSSTMKTARTTLGVRAITLIVVAASVFLMVLMPAPANADPCGMVPPIYTGAEAPITRIGLQQTYVYFDDGVESFVIRPGFRGKIDSFGMLIPFPTPPSLRKVPDNIEFALPNTTEHR